jgi:hypothetical protein
MTCVETVRYRPRWSQLPWLNPVVVTLVAWRDLRLGEHPAAAVLFVLSWPVLFVLLRRTGVTLAPDALHTHGLVRTRAVPWRQVDYVTTRRRLGSTMVEVRTTTGRRIRPRAPVDAILFLGDPEFYAKVDTITRYWREGVRTDEEAPAAARRAP